MVQSNLLKTLAFFAMALSLNTLLFSQTHIRLNQLGYYPDAPKVFVVADTLSKNFEIKTTEGTVVFKGALTQPKKWTKSGEMLQSGNFTSFQKPGKYYIELDNKLKSYSFEI